MAKDFDIRKGADATERLSQMLEAPIFDKYYYMMIFYNLKPIYIL